MSFALENISSLFLQNYYLKMHPPRCSWWGPLNSIKFLAESPESSYFGMSLGQFLLERPKNMCSECVAESSSLLLVISWRWIDGKTYKNCNM